MEASIEREKRMIKKPALEIKNVIKKIKDKTIIDNLSFNVYPGEVFGFLGPNGAGKTTTIRMIFGLTSMTEGEIYINGKSIKRNFEEAVLNIGGIIETPEMYKYLTGYQNLVHFARMYKGIGKDRINKMVDLVELENRIHDKVKTYSLGMRQRLGLAQALLHSPSVLVLDEPTNGLDPAGIKDLRDYLRKIAAEENVAVCVSSHLLSEMELMCDRVGIIQKGKLVDTIDINNYHDSGKSADVVFELEPVNKAKEIFSRLMRGKEPIVQYNKISIELNRESIPDVVRDLVKEGISVYGVGISLKTLEDRFLELTGGGQIE